MKFMLDCRDLSRLLSQSQDNAPAPAVRARICLHLMACRNCRNVDAQMRFVRAAMQQLKSPPIAGRAQDVQRA